MSRTKEEKKRKRDEEAVAEGVPKKSKKSKKTEDVQDAPAPETAVVEAKKDKKDKKEKKSKKPKDVADAISEDAPVKEKKEKRSKKSKKDTDSAPADEAELIRDMKASENFISVDDDEPMPDADSKKDKKKSKKDKESKKSKKNKEASDDIVPDAEIQNGEAEEPASGKKEKKDKKEKKEKKEKKDKKDKKAKNAAESETNGAVAEADSPTETSGETTAEEQNGEVVDGADGEKKGRFIVFVGNLPYSATKEQIEEHFVKIKPTEIRLRTYKGTNKFMGTCFVEFDRFDRMETCLKKYHHSLFPDGKKGSEGRKINVELSAGGGGNSEERKSKIAAKNEKLHDERAKDREKRAEIEMKQGERKEKKDARAKKDGKEADTSSAEDAQPNNGNINPARLAMMSRPEPTQFRRRF